MNLESNFVDLYGLCGHGTEAGKRGLVSDVAGVCFGFLN